MCYLNSKVGVLCYFLDFAAFPCYSYLDQIRSALMIGCLSFFFFVCVYSFDEAMQTLSSVAGRHTDDLFDVFVEMRGHLYLHAGTLLLKLAQDRQQTWRSVIDLAALCYLLAYQVLTQQPANTLLGIKQTTDYSL